MAVFFDPKNESYFSFKIVVFDTGHEVIRPIQTARWNPIF